MKLSTYARRMGVSYRTAYLWFRSGKIPARAEQLPSGTIMVYEDAGDTTAGIIVHI